MGIYTVPIVPKKKWVLSTGPVLHNTSQGTLSLTSNVPKDEGQRKGYGYKFELGLRFRV